MNSSSKRIMIILCIFGTILIITGLSLSLKEMLDEENNMLNVADNPNYYQVIYHLNGATSIDNKVSKCKIDNTHTCKITLPFAKRNGGTVLGYSDVKDDTKAKYQIGDSITLDHSIELYVISMSEYKLVFEKNDVDYLEVDTMSCQAFNEKKECGIILPNFNKIGYENKGFSTSRESLVGFIYPSDEYKINKDTTLYPIYSTSARNKSLNITRNFTYQSSFVEVEEGCNQNVYSEFLKYLDGIKDHAPFLLLGNKIAFVTDKTFDEIWGKTYVGMNYGPKSLRSVDIRCSNHSYNDYYATMVHEMAHSWDFYYATKLGDNISSQSDVINLYNKYKDKKNRPFRDYSYTSIYEFIADMMRYYYFKYNVPRAGFSNLNYPNDIKNVLEKYICISKNNYDESMCVQ